MDQSTDSSGGEATEMALAEERRLSILDALSSSLASKKRDAIAARAASGIEEEWEGDQGFYDGYDDANAHEFKKSASKPTASGANNEPLKKRGSTVFPNVTQPYVDAAAARVGDMLLPTDDRNFALDPTPMPDMIEQILGQKSEDIAKQLPQPMAAMLPMVGQPQMPGQPPMPGAPAQPSQPMTPIAQAVAEFEKLKKDAARKAEKAQEQIDDWLMECQYHAEVRKVIDDAAKLGSGVLKGPVPMNRRSRMWQRSETGESVLVIKDDIKPGSRRIDPWNFFPDGACGESIHDGGHTFERDFITQKKLEELKKIPGYIARAIDLCIEEGPKGASSASAESGVKKGQYEIWYFYGDITADEMLAAGVDVGEDKQSYPALMTMVNDRVIHAALNPLDCGSFPYDVIPWKRRPNMPWGMGVSRQIRTPQRIVTAATRNLMDNAGLAGGPQFVLRRGIEPENGVMEIVPFKIWIEGADSDGQAGPPFLSVIIPMLQAELNNIILMGMKMCEDVTGLPQLMQGSQGAAPDTVGGMTILNNNANAVLRRFARLFDSCITEPHIRRYYTWLMEYGEDAEMKGDFQIVARGSSALIERDMQKQEAPQILQMSLNPAFGLSPKQAMQEYLKSRRYDPAAFEPTEEEKAALAQQQPAPAPQVQVAQIRSEADLKKAEMQLQAKAQESQADNQIDMTRIQADVDRDTIYVQAETQRTEREHEARMAELSVKRELAMLEYANTNKITLDKLKTDLARDSMKLRTQKELAAASNAMKVPQVARPAIEPQGRAPNGQAFQA